MHHNSAKSVCEGALSWWEELRVESRMVANGTYGSRPAEIELDFRFGQMVGANNLIESPLPPDTIVADPRLAPLAYNGGLTRPDAAVLSRRASFRANEVPEN